ncbi:hypothetical protein HYS91_02215 [Candidatus Daviesbacteria bacterium]|nr:hypothetical protein [Candidatus Daviesbacteria bacterium]
MKICHHLHLNNKGQSLLEITIALGVAVLVITALTVTTLIGLRNSQFSQNQVQATKLAQEGLEKIKQMRNRNTYICSEDGTNYSWKIDEAPTANIWQNLPVGTSSAYYFIPTQGNCELKNALNTSETQLSGIFHRKIFVENINGEQMQKKFTAQVYWDDPSGSHKSELITILTNY